MFALDNHWYTILCDFTDSFNVASTMQEATGKFKEIAYMRFKEFYDFV